ncbi:MAG: hypothetical protein ABIP77_09870 [Candidatus Limnocylindrales bacterium]
MNEHHRPRHFATAILLFLAGGLTACGTAAAPSAAPTVPSDTVVTSPPSVGAPGDPGLGSGGGRLVVPKPGQLDVRAIPVAELTATVSESTIVVTATWTSGVEPCNVLDSIVVDRGEGTYSITLREGHGPEEIACIAIAEQHLTTFEIPDVAPGTYTIRDAIGGAPDIQVAVS